jgi:uncharacterized protein DUF4126
MVKTGAIFFITGNLGFWQMSRLKNILVATSLSETGPQPPPALSCFAMIGRMNPIETLGMALGAGFSSGLNLYATVATLGLLERFGVIHLPTSLHALSHPAVLAIAVVLYVVEFFADKIPYVDTAWDALHTFIRPPAAALLAYGAAGAAPAEWRWAAALLAGGVALTSHGTKASARAAVNTVPEPFSNAVLSFGEDVLAVWLTWMATAHPLATTIIVVMLIALSVFLLFHLFRFARRALQRLFAV